MSTAPTIHPDDDILTPTVRRFLRRSLFWIGIATIIVIIATIGLLFAGSIAGTGQPLGPGNPAPEGTKALARVLEQQGVDVTVTDGLDATADAIDDAAGTTLLVHDPDAILTEEQWERAADLADTLVLVDPGFEALTVIAPDVYQAGIVDEGTVEAGCGFAPAQTAGTITRGGSGFRTDEDAEQGAGDRGLTTCFDSGDDTFSLIRLDEGAKSITVFGATDTLTNGRIVEKGNAALALGLLGSQPALVWYTPGLDDYDDAPATVADFAPGWVFPVSLTLVLIFIAIAIWRGRRFGPLIVENLPVTVRSSETMLGRARLYERSSARLHAIDTLRIGTIDRLSKLVGLPRLATVDEVVRSVAALSGPQEPQVRMLLVDAIPQNDRHLIELSDQLLLLEGAVADAVRST